MNELNHPPAKTAGSVIRMPVARSRWTHETHARAEEEEKGRKKPWSVAFTCDSSVKDVSHH